MPITFVTGNSKKVEEASAILGGTPLQSSKIDLPEIQSMSLEEVVLAKARAAYEQLKTPIIVDDVGVEIEAMNGFPGPFVKFWEQVAGYDKALIITEHEHNNRAHIYCAVVYKDADHELVSIGKDSGQLVPGAGENGWGFDKHFKPDGSDKTYAEMSSTEKNQISHRFKAFSQLKQILQDKHLI